MRRMTAWCFVVDPGNGAVKRVTFYARSKVEAVRLARAWAERFGFKVELEDDLERTA